MQGQGRAVSPGSAGGQAGPTADVAEVFSTIQGEGLLVGTRQVFCRFYGCDLDCMYCDTPASRMQTGRCVVERTPGARDFEQRDNPFTPERLLDLVLHFDEPPGLHHSVALTGGEPLERADFLVTFAPLLRRRGVRTYLETNGVLPEALQRTIDGFDIIAMDVKLPSAIGRDVFAASREFLRIAQQHARQTDRPDVFVKVVLTAEAGNAELVRAFETVAGVDRRIPVVLQPVTPAGAVKQPPGPARVLEVFDLARGILNEVRVIPQVHRLMQQL